MSTSKKSAEDIIQARQLNNQSLVVEAASNDGYMLKNFIQHGIPVLGIDPAEQPTKAAQEAGVPTLCTFFTVDLAKTLHSKGCLADIFLANNVLAHVPDLNGFVQGIKYLLKDNGLAVIEVPYVVDLIDNCEFDTIYHQHLCYFSVLTLDKLFRKHSLFINDIEQTSIHGGSLRIFIEPKENVRDSVKSLIQDEQNKLCDRIEYYQAFAKRVLSIKKCLVRVFETT